MQYLYSIDLTNEFWKTLSPRSEDNVNNFGFFKPVYYLPFFIMAVRSDGVRYFALKLADLKVTFHPIKGESAGILKLSDRLSYFIQPNAKKPPVFIQGVIGSVVDDSGAERAAKIDEICKASAEADAEYYQASMSLEEREQVEMPTIVAPTKSKRKELVERYGTGGDTELIG